VSPPRALHIRGFADTRALLLPGPVKFLRRHVTLGDPLLCQMSLRKALVHFPNICYPPPEKVIIWVKWAPNLATFATAFCPLRTHARQGLIQNPCCPSWVPIRASLDSHASPPFSLPLDFSVQQPLRPQPVSETRWPLPYRLPRFSSAAHLTRSRSSCHGNPALQSQGGQDNTESQTVQGASQPTRPTLSAGGLSTQIVPSK
jgi:hypothetical protein